MKNVKRFYLLILAAIVVTGTHAQEDVPVAFEKELQSGILLDNMDLSVNPGENFTKYVNGKWMDATEIPADKSSYGIGTILHEESEDMVKAIIEASASGDYPAGSDEQKVGDFYASFMDMEKRNAMGVAPLKTEFDKIEGLKNYDDLATYFAYANKQGFSVPLGLFVYQDFKNPEIYTVYAWQSGLALPDREYYLKTDERSKEIKSKYVEHIEKMFSLAGLPDGANAA
ncbi:MAG: M13 family metallopeptidase N-terminal domain-containing protein, partial [Flavobacteriaceae bacterium]